MRPHLVFEGEKREECHLLGIGDDVVMLVMRSEIGVFEIIKVSIDNGLGLHVAGGVVVVETIEGGFEGRYRLGGAFLVGYGTILHKSRVVTR